MDIYISPPNAPYTEKTNEKAEIHTAEKSEVYTKEEVEKLLEEMLKKIKGSEVQ